jgi:O-antigen ligase
MIISIAKGYRHKQSYLNWLFFSLGFAIFSCSLIVDKVVNASFYALILLSIATLLFQRNSDVQFWAICKQYWPVILAMFGIFSATLFRQLSEGVFTVRLYDLPARLALFILVFWIVLQLPIAMLRKLKWGFMLGVILYAISIYIESNGGRLRINTLNSFSIIFSSELALLMGVFALLSIGWEKSSGKWVFVLQLLAGLCGLYSVYLSQARGAWLSIPLFTLLIIFTLMQAQRVRTKIIACSVILLVLFGALSTTPIVQERIERGKQDWIEFSENKNLDNSLGIRLQLWNASWILFKEHPLFGVGKEHFNEALHTLSQRKILTPEAASQYHSHHELLYSMATLGLAGLIGTLLTYLVPTYFFAKQLPHPDSQIRSAAAMGLSLCLGYIIFGLVDVMISWYMCAIFYTISIAVFLAFIFKRNRELDMSDHHI